uniref:glutathione S-transferase N-terminal domain-containing protein n=1 Tax=Methylosinus sp. RM1 TaxID=2583817 RepID=UPI001FEECA6C
MKLHAYGRSSASFRVRIALNLKGLSYETVSYDLTRDEQRDARYLSVNPQGLLPALEDNGAVLTQSLAIIEYIDAKKPEPPLLPREQLARARVRALAQLIGSDTHPLITRRVAHHLRVDCGQDEQSVQRAMSHKPDSGALTPRGSISSGCRHRLPLSHRPEAMQADGDGGPSRRSGWNEEIADCGEDVDEMLQPSPR